ncbi:MAG: Bug family tripartite tricarboxylate transporter substrate binding protein [Rhodospirillales bacterium]
MKITNKLLALATGVAVIGASASQVQAEWPERPITAVVMYGAGGGTDTVIRTLAGEIAKTTGWNIKVINKPGAVGGKATRFVLNKKDDAYTWLGAANYNKFVRVMGHSKSKAWEDWQYFQAANALASWSVRPDSPFKTLEQLIAHAKKNPGKLTISTSGTGGLWQELALIVSQAAGITLKYIPYKGGKAATLAGLQGEVDIAGGGVHEHIDFIRSGKLRNLQTTSATELDAGDGIKLRSVGDIIPSLKPVLPLGGIYNFAVRRTAPLAAMKKFKVAFTKAANSETFAKIAKRKFFQIDVRTGAAADRRAAQVEAITAKTFWAVKDQIGKKVLPASELGLPDPSAFDKWWPPQGYKAIKGL